MERTVAGPGEGQGGQGGQGGLGASQPPGGGRRRWPAALGLLVAVSAAIFLWVVLRSSVTTDITAFLATDEDGELAGIAVDLAESELSRAWIITIGGDDEAEVLAAADDLRDRLTGLPGIAWAQRGIDGQSEAFYELYFPRRLHFASDRPEDELPALLGDDGLEARAKALLRELSLPQATVVKRIAGEDPLLLFVQRIRGLRSAGLGDLRPVGGHLLTAEGEAALFFSTTDSPFDGAAMKPLALAIDAAIARVNANFGGHLRIEESTVARHALAAEENIRGDIRRISLVSLAGLLLLFVGFFRRTVVIAGLLLPLAFGMLVALAATILLFGQVHGMTLAFGATLIGVAIDYSVHLVNHHILAPAGGGPEASARRIGPGLRLGALTTIAGFAGLAWTSFPGLREMAVFASVGVFAALLCARYMLPALLPAVAPSATALQRGTAALCGRLVRALEGRRRWLGLFAIAVLGLTALGLTRVEFVDDIRAFSVVDPGLLAADERVRAQVSRMDAGRFVIALGADDEAALVANDAAALRLEEAVAAGELGGYRSLHTFLWSAALQRRSLAVFRDDPTLGERLQAAYAREGFRPEALAPFTAALAAEPTAPLTFAELADSPLAGVARGFRMELGERVAIVTMVGDVRDPEALAVRLQGLDGVHLFDQAATMTRAYRRYRQRTQELLGFGLVAVFVLLLLHYRRLRLALAAFVPAVAAAALTIAILGLLGVAIHLLHVVALLLVLSIGVDYGVFLVECRGEPRSLEASVLSVLLASLSTVLAFGLLAMSSFPALRALGLTIGVGVVASLVLAPISLVLLAPRREVPEQ